MTFVSTSTGSGWLSDAAKLLAELLTAKDRAKILHMLAQGCGGEEFVICILDDEIGKLLPAPGFPATFPDRRQWEKFLVQLKANETFEGTLYSRDGRLLAAHGTLAFDEKSACILLGGEPELVLTIAALLPLFVAAIRGIDAADIARLQIKQAERSVSASESLAKTLDLTRGQLQRALVAAEAANRSKDEFLAVVSHELRSPLNAILGWAQIIRMSELNKEETEQALHTIERNAKVQSQLIEDILDHERIVTGKVRMQNREYDMLEVVNDAIQTVRPLIEEQGIDLSMDVPESISKLYGDADRMQQVIWNLLTNAIKFTEAEGEIKIGIQETVISIRLTISDNGAGIAQDFLPVLFERFQQADVSTTRRNGGLGLGLAIVKNLVEMQGGTIEARSEGLGRGAEFIVEMPTWLPELAAPAASNAPPLRRQQITSLAGVRVLIVDDNKDARELVGALLTKQGATVLLAGSAEETLSKLEGFHPELLISDIEMPGMDGIELINEIRTNHPEVFASAPAVALTGHARPADQKQALDAGFRVHIKKPIEPIRFLECLAGLLVNTDHPAKE